MNEHLLSIQDTVPLAKIITPISGTTSVVAFQQGQDIIAWAGLIVTIIFGALGLIVSGYFKLKQHRRENEQLQIIRKKAEHDALQYAMAKKEHEATMQRILDKTPL